MFPRSPLRRVCPWGVAAFPQKGRRFSFQRLLVCVSGGRIGDATAEAPGPGSCTPRLTVSCVSAGRVRGEVSELHRVTMLRAQ